MASMPSERRCASHCACWGHLWDGGPKTLSAPEEAGTRRPLPSGDVSPRITNDDTRRLSCARPGLGRGGRCEPLGSGVGDSAEGARRRHGPVGQPEPAHRAGGWSWRPGAVRCIAAGVARITASTLLARNGTLVASAARGRALGARSIEAAELAARTTPPASSSTRSSRVELREEVQVQGNSSIAHIGPGASASRASSVTSGAPISSASATYAASYVVRFARSSQQRSSKGRCGTRRIGNDFRSSRASCIRRSSRPPPAALRRHAERTSTSRRCGAARRSPANRARCRSPSGPSSANAVTTTLASTTITASRDRRGPPWPLPEM